MEVGFTGTQRGLTVVQYAVLSHFLAELRPTALHHGDCVGADATADDLAARLSIKREAHPGLDKHGHSPKRAYCAAEVIHEPLLYMERNGIIAQHPLIVCPGEYIEQQRSGTWATFRRRRQGAWVITPDGNVKVFERCAHPNDCDEVGGRCSWDDCPYLENDSQRKRTLRRSSDQR
jgi:hypothetical protein